MPRAAFPLLILCEASLRGGLIPVTDANLLYGLSPYNWVCQTGFVSSTVNGASMILKLKATREAGLRVATSHLTTKEPMRFPMLAWTVNGGSIQTHQLAANEESVVLSSGVSDPLIEIYIRGMSPFEDRYSGDTPPNSVKITGILVDAGGVTVLPEIPRRIWLNLGDSILSGDGAAYDEGHGRPPDDGWAASEDGRASYGYLLARHYGYREARIAYGGYNWGGGMGGLPALAALIDQRTSTTSRLQDGRLNPLPDVALINLGENGAPSERAVTNALARLRLRAGPGTKIVVMIPVSGRARDEVTRAFQSYRNSALDERAFLVDLGRVSFATCDGQHPTAAGHRTIYQTALPALDIIVGKGEVAP